MAEETISKEMSEIKKNLKTDKLVFGKDKTLKLLKSGKLSKICLASNFPEDEESDIKYYADLANVNVIKLALPNDELGSFCKKPFFISVISFLK